MRKVDTYGHIDNGILKIHRRAEFLKAVAMLNGRVTVTVEKLYRKRGSQQNRYYHGVIINDFRTGYFDTTGESVTSEEAHEILKKECNYKEIFNESTGEVLKIGKTTTDLTTVEFEEYLEECRKFIFNWFGITVLLPNEQGEIWK